MSMKKRSIKSSPPYEDTHPDRKVQHSFEMRWEDLTLEQIAALVEFLEACQAEADKIKALQF